MTITLASLIARLEADAPAVSGVPSAAQYAQAVKDAVADLSRRASVPRQTTLSVVSGTASYTLPSDCIKLIRLSQIGVPVQDNVWITPAGLVPMSGSYREQITISGDQLIIYPTPTVSADRTLLYAAGDALNVAGDAYDTLSEQRASIALLHARAACLERIASSPGGQAQKISGLGYTIDSSSSASGQRSEASGLRSEYLAAVDSLNSAIGGLG